jgi:Na+/H+-translocating membrane pyrophosphatase
MCDKIILLSFVLSIHLSRTIHTSFQFSFRYVYIIIYNTRCSLFVSQNTNISYFDNIRSWSQLSERSTSIRLCPIKFYIYAYAITSCISETTTSVNARNITKISQSAAKQEVRNIITKHEFAILFESDALPWRHNNLQTNYHFNTLFMRRIKNK